MFVAEGVHVLYQQSQVYQDLLVRTVGPYLVCSRQALEMFSLDLSLRFVVRLQLKLNVGLTENFGLLPDDSR